MQYNDKTPRVDGTIGGIAVKVIAPYAAGHTITEGEASQLNQVFKENVFNNLRAKVALGVVTGEGDAQTSTPYTTDTLQPLIDKAMAEYEMGVRKAAGEPRVTDPVEKEARVLARAAATDLVKQNGMKPGDVDMASIATQVFDANRDALMKAASKIVADRAKQTGGIDLSGIDLTAKPAASEGEAEPAAA